MRTLLIVAVVLSLAACGKPEPPKPAFESADALAANPERLKELRAACKGDHDKVGDAQCNAVAEATRRRFIGDGTPYTPRPAASAVSAPAGGASS